MLAVQTNEKCGTGVFFRDAAGNDAHNALVPAFISQNDGFRRLSQRQHGYSLLINFRFHSLPLPVQLTQLSGHMTGPGRIIGEEQFQCQFDFAHAACGIDPGSQHKADGGGTDGFGGTAAFCHQSGNTGALGMGQRLQTPCYENTVFSLQGHYVRNSAKTDHVGVLFQHFLLRTGKRGGQLKGDADTGEVLMGIAAVGAVRVHHCCGIGQNFFAFVVVGDDQINAQFPAQLSFGNSGNSAVHGDDQLNALAMELMDGDGI